MTLVDLADRRSDLVASLTFIAAMSPDPEAGMGEDFFAALEADPVDGMLRAMATTEASDRAWVEAEFARAAERAEPRPDAVAIHQDAAFRGSRRPSTVWLGSRCRHWWCTATWTGCCRCVMPSRWPRHRRRRIGRGVRHGPPPATVGVGRASRPDACPRSQRRIGPQANLTFGALAYHG